MRVVPRENERINETWIADRDRFSYLGIYSPERVEVPMVKEAGEWQVVDWETALEAAASGLAGMPPDQLGALISPQATLEELYLAQRILRGLGSQNIDHRLRQSDFSDQGRAPLFPWLGMAVEDVESLDAALVVGSNLRKEQPILNHRLRKAALAGAEVTVVNPFGIEPNLPLADQVIAAPAEMLRTLAGMTKAAFAGRSNTAIPPALASLLSGVKPSETEREAVRRLKKGQHTAVFLGDLAVRHPWLHLFRALAGTLAERTGAQLGYVAGAANTAGAWLAGALPHRGPAGAEVDEPGLHAQAMLASPRKAYLLLGVEPEMDCEQPARAVDAMDRADFVVSLSPFASDSIRQHADVLLPVGTFAETSGTFVNLEGRWQSFEGAARPVGEARPGWKVLRVLGNRLGLRAFDYMSSQQVRDELKQQFAADTAFSNAVDLEGNLQLPESGEGLLRLSTVPIYAIDPLVRRSSALQETPDAAVAARMSQSQAEALGLAGAEQVVIEQDGGRATLALIVDDSIPEGYVWVPAGVEETSALSAGFGQIQAKQA